MRFNIFEYLTLFHILKFSHGFVFPSFMDPDTGKHLYEFMESHDWVYENHTVVSPDGYHINAVRLPRARGEIPGNKKKPCVLLVHGYASQPQLFMVKLNDSLAMMLVEAGFDVWIMATRGCVYSLKHEFLSPKDAKYWDFSFHEVSYYDVPAYMDHIRNVTGNEKISYVGHSMGALVFLAFAATRPEYLKRIDSAHAWAPVVYNKYARTLEDERSWQEVRDEQIRKGGVKGDNEWSQLRMWLAIIFCNEKSPFLENCTGIHDRFGPDRSQVDKPKLLVHMTNEPSGSSFKTYLHFLQMHKADRFQFYDYELFENLKRYGRFKPPLYNLRSISGKVPIIISYGLNDYYGGPEDFERLIAEIPGAIGHIVPWPFFNHVDFVFAKDAKTFVYNDCVRMLKMYATVTEA
ncbi:unnamed protein product [Ceutorhynchus assimilis]|uniref:Lipase n=1 Tax=Ceutorhynchus assimilis TaxID=467358 RepID=A0A9N9MYC7_9CUCU|nr:unnamed protein product [Ceutorhynchus assimilis]